MKRYQDGGQALLTAIRNSGIEYIFCSPGSEWAPIWEALALARHDGIEDTPRYFDLWHETVAVGMATGYTLCTGRPQAVLLHAGAGLLQGTCAIHGALLAGTPMVIVSSESITYGERPGMDPGSQWYRNLSIVGGPHGLVHGIVKWANQVGSVENLYEMFNRTVELAVRAPGGPCYLNVPVEVLLEPWTPPKFARQRAAAGRKLTPGAEIDSVAELLVTARNPLIMVETAGRDAGGFTSLQALAEALAIPVIEPQSAVCANFPRSHPLHLGATADAFMESTDLVLLVNCRAPWYPPSSKPPHALTVVIDEVPQRPHIVYQVLHADRYLEGEVADTLQQLTEAVHRRAPDKTLVAERRARHARTHTSLESRIAQAEENASKSESAIDPVLLASELRLLSDNTIFVDETITHSRVLQQHLKIDQPGRYYYVQGGLGQGIAVALGVKLATPDRPVVLTVGDGSFLYNPIAPSLAAARDLKLPLLMVIFNNRQYLSMKFNHLRAYPEGAGVSTNTFFGVNLETQPDLAEFARPFGMYGVTIERPADLRAALLAGLRSVRSGVSAIVNVMLSK